MAKITAIQSQKRDAERVNIHLDGEYAFSLSRLVAAWLRVGQDLDAEKIASLQAGDASERAYQQALLFLGYRARSIAEIRRNLRSHKFSDEVIEHTLERLRTERLADDHGFAKLWVENRTTFRPRSRRALAMELRQKGIPDEAVQSALAGLDEEALAYEAASKRLRRLESLDWDEFRTKLSEYLARRGFSYAVVAPVVARVWQEARAERHTPDNEESA